jgi:hypothetical protein
MAGDRGATANSAADEKAAVSPIKLYRAIAFGMASSAGSAFLFRVPRFEVGVGFSTPSFSFKKKMRTIIMAPPRTRNLEQELRNRQRFSQRFGDSVVKNRLKPCKPRRSAGHAYL